MAKSDQASQWYICSLKDLSWFFNLKESTFIQRTKLDDFPKDAKLEYGKYDLKKCYDWMQAHWGDSEAETTLAAERLRKLKAQADKEEMERDVMMESLISRVQVKQDLAIVFTGIKQRFMGWYKSLPPLLIEKNEKEIGLILRKEIFALLEDLSKGMKSIMPKKKKRKGKK